MTDLVFNSSGYLAIHLTRKAIKDHRKQRRSRRRKIIIIIIINLKRMKEADVDQQKTHWWLRSTGLKAETESLIISTKTKQTDPTTVT